MIENNKARADRLFPTTHEVERLIFYLEVEQKSPHQLLKDALS